MQQPEDDLTWDEDKSAWTEVVRSIGHRLNNLVTVILGQSGLGEATVARGHPPLEQFHEISVAARGIEKLTTELLSLAPRTTSRPETVDMGPWLESLLHKTRNSAPPGLTLEFTAPSDELPLSIVPELLETTLHHLMINASQALGGPGTIKIALREQSRVGMQFDTPLRDVILTLEDNGPGFPLEVIPQIENEFHMVRNADGKIGKGLAFVNAAVGRMHGQLRVDNKLGGGARVTLTFSGPGRN